MALGRLFYRTLSFMLSIVMGALLFKWTFDQDANILFEHLNKGKH
uniref:Complex III subunit 9 n=1 Tax=Anolis carolinensis TaxID=28377 RepID=A0A803STB8_ANOCA